MLEAPFKKLDLRDPPHPVERALLEESLSPPRRYVSS